MQACCARLRVDGSSPEPAKNSLDQADAKMRLRIYRGAQALYAEFVNANPANPRQPGCAQSRQSRSSVELSNRIGPA